MEELSLGIFVVPTIALTLVILGYLYFAKQVKDVGEYKRFVFAVAVTSFVLNFIWELAQGPLYEGFEYDWQHISFCALASIADMLMVLILFFGFALVYRNIYWIMDLDNEKIVPLILIGSVGAIIGEIWHITHGDWSYAEAMPLVPLVEIGLSPLLQFALLPYIIFSGINRFMPDKNLEM
tara:strand:- start:6067 stop:6606 length:540 start_codon:yes stop_codon:yes gene_type:complete